MVDKVLPDDPVGDLVLAAWANGEGDTAAIALCIDLIRVREDLDGRLGDVIDRLHAAGKITGKPHGKSVQVGVFFNVGFTDDGEALERAFIKPVKKSGLKRQYKPADIARMVADLEDKGLSRMEALEAVADSVGRDVRTIQRHVKTT